MSVRVVVCGGRSFADRMLLDLHLDRIHAERGIAVLIDGGSRGADLMAREWARRTGGISMQPYRACWRKHGRAAGPIRNQRMLDCGRPDLVIAFPGGRGTADMVRRATAAVIEVIRVSA